MILSLFTVVLIVLIIYSLYKVSKSWSLKEFPPGPRGWPLVGNLPEFRKQPLECLVKWKKTYGNIVGLRIGEYRVVILSGVSNLREAFNDPVFNSRANLIPFALFAGGENHGTLTSAKYDVWDEVRKFTIKNINEIEFGKRGTEQYMIWNVQGFIKHLEIHSHSVCIYKVLMVPICRYVWYLASGSLMDINQTILLKDEILAFSSKLFIPIGSSLWMLPKLSKLFPTVTGYTGLMKQSSILHKLIQTVVDAKRDIWVNQKQSTSKSENVEPYNIMQGFIWKLWENQQNTESALHGEIGADQMRGTIMNVFIASVVTSCNTLNWAVAFMGLYPEIQRKLHAEAEEVMGVNCARDVELNDMNKMPYTCAFMKEVFRISSSCSFSNFHETISDVEFQGYWIPRKTVVIGNLYGVNHDEETWGDPEVFRPERFLISPPPTHFAFGVGLRRCPGQAYATNTFFLYLVSICKNYTVEFDNLKNSTPTPQELQNDCLVSLARIAKYYYYIFKKRV